MKVNHRKVYNAIMYREKLPRKVKKYVLGKKMSKSKLNRLLKSVVVKSSADTMYDAPEILPHPFCPNCGCTGEIGSGNLTSYPEHWEKFYCIRCHEITAYIDNSPYIHALECKEDNYNPVF